MKREFKEGELVIYAPKAPDGNIYRVEIGKFKCMARDPNHAFILYHSGETSACTNLDDIYKLENYYYVKTCLGTFEEYN